MTDEEIAKVQAACSPVPMTAGEIVLAYNLPGVTELKLPRDVYPDIFLGKITKWNDPRIEAANPGAKLPDLPITVVRRADSAAAPPSCSPSICPRSARSGKQAGFGTTVELAEQRQDRRRSQERRRHRHHQADAGRDRLHRIRLRQARPRSRWRSCRTRPASTSQPDAKPARRRWPAPSWPDLRGWVDRPGGRQAYPIATYTWMLFYKTTRCQEGRGAAQARRVLPDRRPEDEPTDGLHPAAGHRRRRRSRRPRTNQINRSTGRAPSPGSIGQVMLSQPFAIATSPDAVSGPPGQLGLLRRPQLSGARLGRRAGLLLVLVAFILWKIGGKALPAIQDYHFDFLISSTTGTSAGSNSASCPRSGARSTARSGAADRRLLRRDDGDLPDPGFPAAAAGPGVPDIVELLAAIPSVVYGLWGIFVVVPAIRPVGELAVRDTSAGSRSSARRSAAPACCRPRSCSPSWSCRRSPRSRRTRCDSVPYKHQGSGLRPGRDALGGDPARDAADRGSTGIFGALVLGFGRALGETMALAMLIGNSNQISLSLFSPANTLAALLALTSRRPARGGRRC